MAKRKKFRVSAVIIDVIFLLLIIALLGGVLYLTRGATQNFKTFSLKIGDKYILRDESNVLLKSGDKIVVNSPSDYSVSVYAYTEYDDFEFMFEGEKVLWSAYEEVDFLAVTDSGLKINKQSDSFFLTYDSFRNIVNSEKYVEVAAEILSKQFDRFRLVVTSNGSEISVTFRVSCVGSIEFSPDGDIVF